MDGVLLDTERLYTEATQRIVGRFGKTFDWSVKGNMIGRPARDSARYLVAAVQPPPTSDLKTMPPRSWFADFAVVVTGDDSRIARGKPAPDVYLLTARDLGVAPERCVAVEDAPAGVEAARAAGMQVVAIPDPALGRDRVATADVVLDSLVGVRPEDLGVGGVASRRDSGA